MSAPNRSMANSSLSSFSIFPATPQQISESRRRIALEWSRGLTVDECLARDDHIDKLEVARDERMITWVLAPRNDPMSLDFLCSCKTFRRDGLVRYRSDANPKEVACYGIATLFTPARFRGKGYAGHMMRLLHWVTADASLLPAVFPDTWGAPPARVARAGDGWFSALWSDVGADYYKRCGPTKDQDGWIARDPVSTTWNVSQISLSPDTTNWTMLDEAGVLKLWDDDANSIAREFRVQDYKVSFSFLPHKGVAAYQHSRNRDILAKDVSPPIQHWGIIANPDTFATWTFEVRPGPKTLLITRLKCSPADFDKLLSKVMSIARAHGMEKIEVYNLSDNLQSAGIRLGGTTAQRGEHMSAFKWYGAEDPREVEWLLNER